MVESMKAISFEHETLMTAALNARNELRRLGKLCAECGRHPRLVQETIAAATKIATEQGESLRRALKFSTDRYKERPISKA